MKRTFEKYLCSYKTAIPEEKEASLKKLDAVAISFDEKIRLYNTLYCETVTNYIYNDEANDILGITCDNLRNKYLAPALELAKTKLECQQVLKRTMERNSPLRKKCYEKITQLTN